MVFPHIFVCAPLPSAPRFLHPLFRLAGQGAGQSRASDNSERHQQQQQQQQHQLMQVTVGGTDVSSSVTIAGPAATATPASTAAEVWGNLAQA